MKRELRPGVELLDEVEGRGAPVRRQVIDQVRLRMWLHRGEAVRWSQRWGPVDRASFEDDGRTLQGDLRVDREQMFAGLFYGVQGMRVGGCRRLRVAPHLAYGASGVPGIIPENALLTVEVEVLEERRPW